MQELEDRIHKKMSGMESLVTSEPESEMRMACYYWNFAPRII